MSGSEDIELSDVHSSKVEKPVDRETLWGKLQIFFQIAEINVRK